MKIRNPLLRGGIFWGLRGPAGAQDEFLLAATVQNLRKLTRYA